MFLGLRKDFLTDRTVYKFLDIDGVLAVYATGDTGINACGLFQMRQQKLYSSQ